MSEYYFDKLRSNIFSQFSNTVHDDFNLLKHDNNRLYKQLDLLFDEKKSLSKNSLSMSTYIDKSKNTIRSFSQDNDFIANKMAKSIKDTLKYDDFVPGEISRTQLLLESMHKENVSAFKDAYQKCLLDLYKSDQTDDLVKFISISSNLDYEILQERADTLIIAGYAHINPFVMEAAIRAIEGWQQLSHIQYLKVMRPSEIEWIENYKLEVIEDLQNIL